MTSPRSFGDADKAARGNAAAINIGRQSPLPLQCTSAHDGVSSERRSAKMRLSGLLLVLLAIVSPIVYSVDHDCPHNGRLHITTGLNRFSATLYQAANEIKGRDENIVISPFSISTVLAMCLAGARGQTSRQMRDVLGSRGPCKKITSGTIGSLALKVKDTHKGTFRSVNKLYVGEGYPLKEKFQRSMTSRFDSEAQNVNFGSDKTRLLINKWVEESTKYRIKDLIPPGALDSMTKLVLANAVHFKNKWQHLFNTSRTQQQSFYLENSTEVLVPMMHSRATYRVANLAELDARVLELPYAGMHMSMLVILPNDRNGLGALEKQLASSKLLGTIDERMANLTLEVAIPKFKIHDSVDVKNALTKIGMTDLFHKSKADLSGISSKNDLYVSDIFHKAFIEVNEEGTEAAAATGMIFMARSYRPQPQPFVADHPFVFLIRDNVSRLVLFSGRLANPLVA